MAIRVKLSQRCEAMRFAIAGNGELAGYAGVRRAGSAKRKIVSCPRL